MMDNVTTWFFLRYSLGREGNPIADKFFSNGLFNEFTLLKMMIVVAWVYANSTL
jgi:hypothetical protein